MSHWQPFVSTERWNQSRIVHLHRRAAWGATWSEVERDLQGGCDAAISRLSSPAGTPLHPRTEELAQAAIARNSISLLKAAWVNEMWHGSDPLGEQLTLMWHNHFATGFQKVQDCRAMFDHYLTLRKHARGSFAELVKAIVRDAAMLLWLDGNSNRKAHPNENLARELMELFTLGEGHYTETDVREAARALTGWTVQDGSVRFDAHNHDAGLKTVLGTTGRLDADGLIKLLVNHPATSRRIAWRICDHLFGRDRVPGEVVNDLAKMLRASDIHIGKAVDVVLRSARFLDDQQPGSRFSGPASFVVSTLRSLELHGVNDASAAIIPEVAAAWMRTLGQDLFQPPGVGGWTGGSTWISAASMIDRARFSLRVSQGTLHARAPGCNLTVLAERHQAENASRFVAGLLFGNNDSPGTSLPELLTSTRAQFD